MFFRNRFLVVLLVLAFAPELFAREWTNSAGNYRIEATLVAFDDKTVVLRVDPKKSINGHELISIRREDLSKEDVEFLASKEANDQVQELDRSQKWTLVDGTTVLGKAVSFVRKDVTIQRRRGRIYVNDRPFNNLPEVYQRIVPRVIEHFESIKLPTTADLERWVLQLRGSPRTFTCEGIILEFENGEEYAFPFFLFAEDNLKALQPSWDKWLAAERDEDQRSQHSLYMQSQATAFQQNVMNKLAVQQEIAVAQMQFMAVASGAVDLWEVGLWPGPGMMAYPISVVVPARNSSDATQLALSQNPGFTVGPIRRVAGNR